MGMGTKRDKRMKRILICLFIGIVVSFGVHLVYVIIFNKQEHVIEGRQEDEDTYMDMGDREGAANTWIKRNFNLKGRRVDITGQTIDGRFRNNSSYNVISWEMEIRINQDCFINKAWNGSVEIHQYVGTENEKVQTLDLMKCTPEEVELEYTVNNGDLMIPLNKGDYIKYIPSVEFKELEVKKRSDDVVIGIIYYYMNSFDSSDYTISFYYHMLFVEGWGFGIFILFSAAFVILFSGWIVSRIAYRNAAKDLKFQQGVISMSDIYSILYFIDLEKDTLTPISADKESEKMRPDDLGAREQLLNMVLTDAEEDYIKVAQEFIDTSTVAERLEKGSIACEYISKTHGWTRIRFFSSQHNDGEPVKKVIFAIQDINDEKITLLKYDEEVEREKHNRNTYLASVSSRTRTWLQNILDLNEKILSETKEDNIKTSSRQIRSIGSIISYTIDGSNDASRLETVTLDKLEEEYSAEDVLSEFIDIAETMVEGTPVVIEKDITPTVPRKLKGDVKRIRQVLVQILSNAVHYTDKGSIRLAVYGKAVDNKAHILFSVKDSGGGLKEKRLKDLLMYIDKLSKLGPMGTISNGHGLEIAACLLNFLGTKLNVISTPGTGTEFYFEIDQEIVDATPIDKSNL